MQSKTLSSVHSWRACWIVVLTLTTGAACGGDDSSGADAKVAPLDAEKEHYGKSYAEWSEAWVQYANAYREPECANPLLDETGEDCNFYQDDPNVFFLSGTFGGVVKRKCTIPEGKALFFPITEVYGDNAGVPEDMLLQPEDIEEYVINSYDKMETKRLWLSLDGDKIGGLAQGGVRSAPYTITLPAGDNRYECDGIKGVKGDFDGFVSGYWVLLAPLEPGEHELKFGVERGVDPISGDPSAPSFSLDVTYELTIE